MKVADINPIHGVDWKEGQTRKASTWTMVDSVHCHHLPIREVFHYSTLMGRFVKVNDSWGFEPISIGWGSVSDQKGINQMVDGLGGWYYSRKGGAEYIAK